MKVKTRSRVSVALALALLAPVSALVPKTASPQPAAMADRRELRSGSVAKAGLKTGG